MAFTRRVLAGVVTIVTVVLGLSLTVAGSAAADNTGAWKAYGNTNPITSSSSTWMCDGTEEIVSNVGAQVCAIRSPSGVSVQAAIIVRNNRSTSFTAYGLIHLRDYRSGEQLGSWECPQSAIKTNSWSVCFGDTLTHRANVYAAGWTNTQFIGTTPRI